MRTWILLLLLFRAPIGTTAQSQSPHCWTSEYLQICLSEDSGLKQRLEKQELQTQTDIANQAGREMAGQVITIPVVFHIVYNNPSENLSDAIIYEQMTILNRDYPKLNADTVNIPPVWQPIAGKFQIRFELATKDTLGNPTTGIIHTPTPTTDFSNSPYDHKINFASLGGANAWNAQHYLNIWVCNLGTGILGYTQMPGAGPLTRDGCVVNYIAVGTTGATPPYNLGRTVTHEVGHWFNLIHTWGPGTTTPTGNCTGGSDLVADTPPEDGANYSSYPPFTVKTDACSPSAPGYMWQNYMNYTDDAGMCFFTNGQVARMQATLHGIRDSIIHSPALGIQGLDTAPTLQISLYPNPANSFIILQTSNELPYLRVRILDLLGKIVFVRDFTNPESEIILDIREVPNGLYLVECITEKQSRVKKVFVCR
jgi:hypothetical protein